MISLESIRSEWKEEQVNSPWIIVSHESEQNINVSMIGYVMPIYVMLFYMHFKWVLICEWQCTSTLSVQALEDKFQVFLMIL